MGNFGSKHLIGIAWLFILIAVLLVVLLTIRKKKQLGERFDQRVIAASALFIWGWEAIKTIVIFNSADFSGVGVYHRVDAAVSYLFDGALRVLDHRLPSGEIRRLHQTVRIRDDDA
ncbi:MAG: hypothetical protein MZU97_20350 [Bacillus subtilis]|nr:hypothetical protein [Bacillus subtilis]